MYLESDELIIGVDENGLGPLAGPLVVTAVCCRKADMPRIQCRDSKKYSSLEQMRRHVEASPRIARRTVEVSPDNLCRWGFGPSLSYAFRLAVESVRYAVRPHYPFAIADGNLTRGIAFAKAYPRADKNYPIVSLASCIGKLRQIHHMQSLHAQYPEYHFDSCNGYGTVDHIAAIQKHGVLPHIHRIPIIARMKGMQNLKTRITP